MEYVQENCLSRHVAEHTRARRGGRPSLLPLICKYNRLEILNCYSDPLRKTVSAILEFEFVDIKEITKNTGIPTLRYKGGNFTDLNIFFSKELGH